MQTVIFDRMCQTLARRGEAYVKKTGNHFNHLKDTRIYYVCNAVMTQKLHFQARSCQHGNETSSSVKGQVDWL
jgi:hypothetical protein